VDSSNREKGAVLLRDGRVPEAVEALRLATVEAPSDVMAWRLLGGALAQAARPQEALAAFEEAVLLQPEAAKNHYNVALTLMTLERRTEAIARLEHTLSLDPAYEQARLRLTELGGSTAPPPLPPLTPAVPESPLVTLGGGTEITPPPPVDYAPSPAARMDTPRYTNLPSPVSGTTPLVLGIVSVAGGMLCGLPLVLAPVAWVLGQNAIKTLDSNPAFDQSQRGSALAGKILGIVGSVLLILGTLFFVAMVVLGALLPNTN
jgi:tetratricopeptide (TPR) repeat protein